MKKIIIFLIALLIATTAFSQKEKKAYLTNDQKKEVVKSTTVANTLIREYHFEIDLGQTKTVLFTDVAFPFPPPIESHVIEFVGSKAVLEVGVNMDTGGSGVGTGKILLNSDVVFGELNFETIEKSTGLNQLIICMIARSKAVAPAGSNALSLDFTKGTLGGLTVQVKVKMYE